MERRQNTGRRASLAIPVYDKSYPAKAAGLVGTKLMFAFVPTKSGGKATRWIAMASGVRAALVMSRMWDAILEGTRKRRFRDWMLSVAIPHTEKVSRGLPRHISRVQKDLGVDLDEAVAELRRWKRKNWGKPREPWKESDRIQAKS